MKKVFENRALFISRLVGRVSKEDLKRIEFAYDLSKESHRTQKRTSGERYFEHPREMCLILMDELGVYEADLLIALLLHDVGEDTPLFGNINSSYENFIETASFRLTLLFGKKVSDIVIKLTKPEVDGISFLKKEEVYDYYIAGLQQEEDAVIGKMIDRLHNLRTLPLDDTSWVVKQITETESVYSPIFSSVGGARKEIAQTLLEKIEDQIAIARTSIY